MGCTGIALLSRSALTRGQSHNLLKLSINLLSPPSPTQPIEAFSWHLAVRENGGIWGARSLVTDTIGCSLNKRARQQRKKLRNVWCKKWLRRWRRAGSYSNIFKELLSGNRSINADPICLTARRKLLGVSTPRASESGTAGARGLTPQIAHHCRIREQASAAPETANFAH